MPLPAFSRSLSLSHTGKSAPSPSDWSLLKPADYGVELPNSVVLVTFHLIHFVIGDNDYWNAIPYSIRLLTSKILDPAEFNPLDGKNSDLILGTPSTKGSVAGTPKKKCRLPSEESPSTKRDGKNSDLVLGTPSTKGSAAGTPRKQRRLPSEESPSVKPTDAIADTPSKKGKERLTVTPENVEKSPGGTPPKKCKRVLQRYK
jgi:hypothetical protein